LFPAKINISEIFKLLAPETSIKVMEERFTNIQTGRANPKILDKVEANIPNYRKLDNYYSSKYWFEDEKSYSKGELPEDLRCGVLSEDLAYNLFGENQDLAIKMIEIATKMLRRQ